MSSNMHDWWYISACMIARLSRAGQCNSLDLACIFVIHDSRRGSKLTVGRTAPLHHHHRHTNVETTTGSITKHKGSIYMHKESFFAMLLLQTRSWASSFSGQNQAVQRAPITMRFVRLLQHHLNNSPGPLSISQRSIPSLIRKNLQKFGTLRRSNRSCCRAFDLIS